MLKELQKKLGMTVTVDTSTITAQLEELRAEFDGYKATAEELLTTVNAEKEQLASQLAEANAQLETLKQFAAAAEAEKARLIAEAEEKRLAARKEKIVAAVGTDRAEALMTATEALGDEQFNAVVAALNVSATVESQSEMFMEIGASVEAVAAKVDEADKPVHFNKFMKK